MKPFDYLKLQMVLEGMKVHDGDFITRLDSGVTEIPLVVLATMSDDQKYIFIDDLLPTKLRSSLIENDLHSFKIKSITEVFNASDIDIAVGHFRTYTFANETTMTNMGNAKVYSHNDPKVLSFGFNGLANEVYAIEKEGRIISACVSSRQNSKAAEAWVVTDPEYRRQGFAGQVVKAWARNMQRKDLVPFYSHEVGNENSARLAAKLNLLHVFDETVIEKSHQ